MTSFSFAAERERVDEQTLIVRAQRGDAQAYQALARRYEPLAFRAAYLITRDEAEASDAAQEAFIRAYRALGSFKLGQPFRPWLLQIVTNQALNRIEAARRRGRATERLGRLMIASQDNPTPERRLAEREQSGQLLQAVGRLKQEEQTLIALRYFLELPEAEVAVALKVPRGTIKSRLHRALARLREIIRTEFPDLKELTELDG